MTQTTDTGASAGPAADRAEPSTRSQTRGRLAGLDKMLMSDLKNLAGTLGIKGTTGMRKSALVEAITSAQSGSRPQTAPAARAVKPAVTAARAASDSTSTPTRRTTSPSTRRSSDGAQAPADSTRARADGQSRANVEPDAAPSQDKNKPFANGGDAPSGDPGRDASGESSRSADGRSQGTHDKSDSGHTKDAQRQFSQSKDGQGREKQSRDNQSGDNQSRVNQSGDNQSGVSESSQERESQERDSQSRETATREPASRDNQGRESQARDLQSRESSSQQDTGSRNSRRRSRSRDRFRDRPATGSTGSTGSSGSSGSSSSGSGSNEREPQVSDDDVLIPAAGILDLLDNYAFVRTTGYLPGPTDVYVSLSMVRKFGLRKGDAITGMVKQSRDADRREKFNPMVRIDTVNGGEPEAAKNRVEFSKLTPLYPADRLRLETEPQQLIGRLIDIVAPVGKGQRGLIVSPSKAGKTIVLQSIANAITTNNPECHLMVVLVDERPEEVTDMQRAVKGEVIASTFDRPAQDHTTVAELAIERAKRLVELGHDVVVLLDSITRLGRAYNLAAPASGRILSGGVDSSALYPPKRFFGAARNIEDGGSLTILATALIETGSKMDEVIFEEFKGTGNMELRLRREFADKRIFPAIDVDASGTRREELLMTKDELAIVWKLRRVLSALEGQQALELLIQKLRKTRSNVEFLMEVNKTTPTASGLRGSNNDDD